MNATEFGVGSIIAGPEPLKGEKSWKSDAWKVSSTLKWRTTVPNGPEDWFTYTKMYEGDQWDGANTGLFGQPSSENPRDRITVNVTQRSVLNYMAFLVRQRSECVLRGKTQRGIEEEAAATALINHFWQEANFQQVYNDAVLDGLIIGHGVVATGFMLELDEASRQDAGVLNYNDYIKRDSPFARRVSPHLFIWDPQAPDKTLETARWCAEIFFLPIRDLVFNSNFSAKVRARIRAGEEQPERLGAFLRSVLEGPEFAGSDPDDDYALNDLVVCIHFWDKKRQDYRLYAMNVKEPLIEEPWKYPELDGFPYIMWGLVPVPERHFPQGIVKQGLDQQLELNRIRTSDYIHRRKYALRKWAQLQNALSATEATKLMNDSDELVTTNLPPDAAIKLLPAPPIPGDNARVDAQIMEDRRQLLGEDELLTGGQLPSRTSAAEIHQRQANIGTMSRDRQARVDKLAEKMWRQLYQLCRANVLTDRLVEVVGEIEAAGVPWEKVSPTVLQEEYDMTVLTTSREDFNAETERGQRTALFQTTLQALPQLQQGGWTADLGAMWDWAMESYPQKARVKSMFFPNPAPPPQEPQGAAPQEGGTQAGADPTGSTIQAESVDAASATLGPQLGGQ